MKSITFDELLPFAGESYSVAGNAAGRVVTNAKTIFDADENSLVWVNPKKDAKQKFVEETRACVIICDETILITPELEKTKCFLIVTAPKLVFLRIVEHFFMEQPGYGIHGTAAIHPDASLHPDVYIGPFTYVGKSMVGEGTRIMGHCHIYDNVTIGNNVVIHAGTIIGADGFGYARNDAGVLEKFPHIGGVVIEDDVEIGANTCIDRGTLGETRLKRGAKIDNLVHIAHNVVVGENAAVIAHAMVGGSTAIGDNAWIAPSAALMNGIAIGNAVTVGMGAVVTKSIPDGETWTGSPAKSMREFVALQKKLKAL